MYRTFFLPFLITLPLIFLSKLLFAETYPIQLSTAQTKVLADLIWQNEGAGKEQYLSVWNNNEAFPSLGIGHFIWYPTSEKGPYVEQFPKLLAFLKQKNITIPNWLSEANHAPWKNQEQFYREFNEEQLTSLRKLLISTTGLQAEFIIKRLEKGIPAILESSTEQQQTKINKNLQALIQTPEGIFVLLDYINFKGEGISENEQYQGYGWGLKQVLLAMPDKTQNLLQSFALAADEMLTRRVKNAPKNELAWLKGWRVRVHKYPLIKVQ